jgi:hypothetical protein
MGTRPDASTLKAREWKDKQVREGRRRRRADWPNAEEQYAPIAGENIITSNMKLPADGLSWGAPIRLSRD